MLPCFQAALSQSLSRPPASSSAVKQSTTVLGMWQVCDICTQAESTCTSLPLIWACVLQASRLPSSPATTHQLDTQCHPVSLRLRAPLQGTQMSLPAQVRQACSCTHGRIIKHKHQAKMHLPQVNTCPHYAPCWVCQYSSQHSISRGISCSVCPALLLASLATHSGTRCKSSTHVRLTC